MPWRLKTGLHANSHPHRFLIHHRDDFRNSGDDTIAASYTWRLQSPGRSRQRLKNHRDARVDLRIQLQQRRLGSGPTGQLDESIDLAKIGQDLPAIQKDLPYPANRSANG
jgi:hypothetical protein